MTTLPTAYTTLESLLLFQALRYEGLNNATAISFNRISDQLKSVPLVRDDPTYDSGRLSPDALRELYLWLVKEEVKRALEHQLVKDGQETNGDASPASRKRKAPSPKLPTVSEAAQHSRLIPQLITRLYARYRENTVRQVQEYERKYSALSSDVDGIEAGTWDDSLLKQYSNPAVQSPKPSTTAHTQAVLSRTDHVQSIDSNTASPISPHRALDATVQVPAKRYSQAKIDAVINHGPEPQSGPTIHRRTSSNTTLPPLSEMAPQSPHYGIPPNIPGSVASMPPHMQHAANPGYSQSPPTAHQPLYASHHAHPIPSPQMPNAMARPSSSPRPILPPPPGMKLPPPTSVQHSGPSGLRGPPLQPQQHYQPQHRSSMGPSPTSQSPQHGYPPPGPPPGAYYSPQPYQDRRPSYPPPQVAPRPYPSQPPHLPGQQLQPFYVNMDPAKQQPKQRLPQQQTPRPPQPMPTPVARSPAYPQYSNALATEPRPHVQSDPRLKGIVAALATPARPLRKPLWKSGRRPTPVSVPDELPQPEIEPLSPVQKRARPVERRVSVARKRVADLTETSPEAESSIPIRQGKGRQERSRSTHSDGSSTAGDSALVPDSRPDGRPQNEGGIKNETFPTADILQDSDASLEYAATPTAGPMTRKRRGTIQSQPQPASKRKRQESPSARPDDDVDDVCEVPPPRPTTIIATRNLAKMAATIMNDITSHKHASYFATPVRNKDASGYSEIIKQPQNLKSIRSALTAGTRAVAAATSIMDSPSDPPSATASKTSEGSTTVELERTEDLMPPKAIVNGAQLEREIYKMLCNAVMFNPGEDGLVADTREMFEDVEAKIREWRGAERDAGVEDEDDGKAKRRKV